MHNNAHPKPIVINPNPSVTKDSFVCVFRDRGQQSFKLTHQGLMSAVPKDVRRDVRPTA